MTKNPAAPPSDDPTGNASRPAGNGAQTVQVTEGEAGQRIDNFLIRVLKGVPKTHVYRLLRTGQVRVNGGRAKPDRRLAEGDKVRLPPVRRPDPTAPKRPPDALLERLERGIAYEDDQLIVFDKPVGLAAHGGSGVEFGLIEAAKALRPHPDEFGLVHRLDRDTSGLLVVAKKRSALRRMHAALRERDMDKRYLALLAGRWQGGTLRGVASTAYRMLMGWPPHTVDAGDVVLVWGAAGGLGAMGLEITRALGGRPVAVVSDDAKRDFCLRHGAVGVINRTQFTHWGKMPDTTDGKAYCEWAKGARAFGKAVWDALGDRSSPKIVFEHPGEATLPTSGFVCGTGGMIVICAGTSGYNVTMDLRYHWMRQKRFQGSHLSNDEQAARTRCIASLKSSSLAARR